MSPVHDGPIKWLILESLHPWHSIILLSGVDPQTLWAHMLCRTCNFGVALEAVRIPGEGRASQSVPGQIPAFYK